VGRLQVAGDVELEPGRPGEVEDPRPDIPDELQEGALEDVLEGVLRARYGFLGAQGVSSPRERSAARIALTVAWLAAPDASFAMAACAPPREVTTAAPVCVWVVSLFSARAVSTSASV
jgi:hypothetical protein